MEQKILMVETGHKENSQQKVNAALEELGSSWRIVSATSSLSTVIVGGTYVDGRIYGSIVTTILAERS